MACPNEAGPWVQIAGTVIGALIGGAGTLLGSWFAQKTGSKDRRMQHADAYQLRIWMELQDALERIDDGLAETLIRSDQDPAIPAQSPTVDPTRQYRTITLRTRILCARLTDAELIGLAVHACDLADQCAAQRERAKLQDLRAKFLKSIELINQRINSLIVESRILK